MANHKLALLSAKVLLGKDEIGYKDGELLEKLDLNLVAIMFDPDKKTCARDVIQKSKEALKALRFKIADSIVCVTQVAAAHKVLSDSQREIELKQIVKNPTQFAALKEIKFNLDVPDKKSFFATSASRLVEIVTTLYRPQSISFNSYWHSDKTRGNDFKTVINVYSKGEKQIEKVLLNIIILAASKCNKVVGEGLKVPMNLQDALNVIEKAQMQGGVYHKKSDAGHPAEFVPWEVKFSAQFQLECQRCGILTGRKNASDPNCGLRTTYIPFSVTKELEKIVDTPKTDEKYQKKLVKEAQLCVSNIHQRYDELLKKSPSIKTATSFR